MKLYMVTCKGMQTNVTGAPYGINYVLATNPTEAEEKVLQFLNENDIGFKQGRQVICIELLASTGKCTTAPNRLLS